MTAVGQVDDFKDGRWYERPGTGERLESVTTVIGATNSKPWLTDWAANTAAKWASTHLDLVITTTREAGPQAAEDLIKGAAKRIRNRARDLGSDVHHLIEALVLNVGALPVIEGLDEDQQAEIDNVAMGIVNFVQDFDPDILMAEATVADPILGVAGTLDLICELFSFGRVLIDAKSGKNIDSSMAAQLVAYRDMTEVWMPTGLIRPMPKVERCAILHLRPEFARGYKLIMLEEPYLAKSREWFHRMLAQYQTGRDFDRLPAHVIYPARADGSQPPPMLEDLEGYGTMPGVLVKNGFANLGDVACKSSKELLDIKGFGPKSLDGLIALLAAHGMALIDAAPKLAAVS